MIDTINVDVLDNGNLCLYYDPDNTEGLEAFGDMLQDYGEDCALYDALEFERCNGSYTPFNAGDGDPFVGLTEAPCIAESMDYLDDGTRVVRGKLWAFLNHMLEDWAGAIARGERVVFQLVGGNK